MAVPARAETGSDAWLRYAPLPAPVLTRVGAVPRAVAILEDAPILRNARYEIVRGLS